MFNITTWPEKEKLKNFYVAMDQTLDVQYKLKYYVSHQLLKDYLRSHFSYVELNFLSVLKWFSNLEISVLQFLQNAKKDCPEWKNKTKGFQICKAFY